MDVGDRTERLSRQSRGAVIEDAEALLQPPHFKYAST